MVIVVLVAFAVRLFQLSILCEYHLCSERPRHIEDEAYNYYYYRFDEGEIASKYIKTLVDVHPPLAKLLIALAGFVWMVILNSRISENGLFQVSTS